MIERSVSDAATAAFAAASNAVAVCLATAASDVPLIARSVSVRQSFVDQCRGNRSTSCGRCGCQDRRLRGDSPSRGTSSRLPFSCQSSRSSGCQSMPSRSRRDRTTDPLPRRNSIRNSCSTTSRIRPLPLTLLLRWAGRHAVARRGGSRAARLPPTGNWRDGRPWDASLLAPVRVPSSDAAAAGAR